MKRVILLSLIIILVVSGCTTSQKSNPVTESECQKIISFTRQALEIEGKRNELMAYFTSFPPEEYGTAQEWLTSLYFLTGVPQGVIKIPSGPAFELEGMLALRETALLLDCTQSMQVIKDALVYIYNSEINLAECEFQHGEEYSSLVPFFGVRFVFPDVNQYNIELWQAKYESWQMPGISLFMNHPWVKLQLLRREVYTHWAEILQEHGVDTLEEGFTSLVQYQKK